MNTHRTKEESPPLTSPTNPKLRPNEQAPLLPGGTIGILGSGQLGRMMTTAAKHMGYRVVVMGPAPTDPAAQVADEWIPGDLMNPADVERLAQVVDVLTVEIENVSAEGLARVAGERLVRPSPRIVSISQDRLKEKEALAAAGFPVAPFRAVNNLDDLRQAVDELGCPVLLKTTRGGYDGKGQAMIRRPADIEDAFRRLGGGKVGLLAEGVLSFQRELSAIVARAQDGTTSVFPIVQNEHVNGILHRTTAPAPVPAGVGETARRIAGRVAAKLDLVGVLAIEMFQLPGGEIVINELAPRPHNSGHFTLDACATSQFEQTVRAVCGLGLGASDLLVPAVMLNVLGEHMDRLMQAYPALMQDPRVKVHLYGKAESRPGRKMGHIVVLADDPEEAVQRADELWALLDP